MPQDVNNWITGVLVAAFLAFGGFIGAKLWDLEEANSMLNNRIGTIETTESITDKNVANSIVSMSNSIDSIRNDFSQDTRIREANKIAIDEINRRLGKIEEHVSNGN